MRPIKHQYGTRPPDGTKTGNRRSLCFIGWRISIVTVNDDAIHHARRVTPPREATCRSAAENAPHETCAGIVDWALATGRRR
jgi:hypothetical protein